MYLTILRSNGLPNKSNAIFKTRSNINKSYDDNEMSPERDSALICRVQTFPIETRKTHYDEIVDSWDMNDVDVALVTEVTNCVAKGYDYLNSTYALLVNRFHGSFFGFWIIPPLPYHSYIIW